MLLGVSAVATGRPGSRAPLIAGCAPHFSLLKILFLNIFFNDKIMMEKGIIMFKHNYHWTFTRFFAK